VISNRVLNYFYFVLSYTYIVAEMTMQWRWEGVTDR